MVTNESAMRNPLLIAALACAATLPARAGDPLSFEVAVVKADAAQWREPKVFDDRLDFGSVSLKYCLAFAYGVKEYQVAGPPWIGELRYEIIAKAPAGAQRDQLPQMMQKLLADRFKLEMHKEKKEFSVFALTLAKSGPKLTEAPKSPDPNAGGRYGIVMNGNVGRMEARNADMTSLANTLPRFVGKPVVNLTNLAGRYDFDVEFSPEDMKFAPPPPVDNAAAVPLQVGVSIYTSIQRLGLRLDSRKLPLDTIVVDRAEKTPIEN
jgi:uncharacterized protein (TIGR03435 family)